MRILLIILLFAALLPTNAQTNFITENEEFIGWQPNAKFEYEDFKAESDSKFLNLCNKYNYSTITNIQVHAFLDVPQKKGQRKRKMEKVYIAPVFCKQCSFAKVEDSIELEQDQIYFMIAEYAARIGRMNFDSLTIKIPNTTGVYSIMFMTLKNDMVEMQRNMNGAYARDILVDKRTGAYQEWKEKLTELLKETEQYETTPRDCHRIISREPLNEGYILAPTVMADQKGRNY